MNCLLPNLIDDLNGTFGRVRIVSHRARFKIKKETVLGEDVLVVKQTRTWGEIEDLYDFNQEAGQFSEWGATVQLGYGNGSKSAYRPAGQIYRTRIFFEKTYGELP